MTPPGVGDPAPDFSTRNQHGQPVGPRPSAGRVSLLFFYPFAFSGICSSELRGLNDLADDLTGCQLRAISCDPMFALRAYADAEGFGFDLLTDFWPHGQIARSYGVFDEGNGAALRGSFLVDEAGTVRWSVVNPAPAHRDLAAHVAAVTELLG